MKPRKTAQDRVSFANCTQLLHDGFHLPRGSLSGESDDNTDSESNESPDRNFQANGDSEPRATKVAFILVDVRSSKAAAVLLFTLIGGFQNLLKHNRFSISKDVVAFRLPHVHALRFFPEWAPKALHAIALSWYAEQAVRAYQSNRPPVARSPDDEKVLQVKLYLMSRVSDNKGQFDQCLHAIDPRTACLARMPTMCVLSIHRGLLAGTYLGALDSLFNSRIRACLGECGNETELDLDVVNITRQGIARRMSLP
jgi:hypothetical protein